MGRRVHEGQGFWLPWYTTTTFWKTIVSPKVLVGRRVHEGQKGEAICSSSVSYAHPTPKTTNLWSTFVMEEPFVLGFMFINGLSAGTKDNKPLVDAVEELFIPVWVLCLSTRMNVLRKSSPAKGAAYSTSTRRAWARTRISTTTAQDVPHRERPS